MILSYPYPKVWNSLRNSMNKPINNADIINIL